MPLSRIPATFLSGQVPDANIAAVAASKLTGQVSDANIAAVAASKLTGQVPDANATSGSVIQAQRVTSTINTTWTTASWIDLWVVGFTPKLATSTLHFVVSLNFLPEGSNTNSTWMDYRGANGQYFHSLTKASFSGWVQGSFCVTYSCPSGGTTAANLRIQVKGSGTTSYWNYPHATDGNSRSSILMLEVV
jgi:hypothetical protein